MKPSIIHSIVICLAALALPLMVACSSQEESFPEEISEATLFLNIAPIGQTRAGTADLPENEKMKTVRVVVLSEGKVEHNKLYSVEAPLDQRIVMLQVKSGVGKKVFLFANEESVKTVEGVTLEAGKTTLTDFFDKYKNSGTPGFEEAVNGIYFDPSSDNDETYIPMSSVYEVKAEELLPGQQIEKTFYVVRVATKFTFSFINGRTDGAIKVNEMTVSPFVDKMYLMPHLYDGSTAIPSEQFKVVDNKDDNNNPSYDQTEGYNGTYKAGGTFWIDWLKQAVDWSQNDVAGYTPDQIGWIHQYKVPTGATVNVSKNISLDVSKIAPISMGGEVLYPTPFYRCEGVGKQALCINSLKITDGTNQERVWTTADDLKLDKVRYLFRHTHVKVSVVFNQKDVAIFARIHPWKQSDPVPPRPLEPVNN